MAFNNESDETPKGGLSEKVKAWILFASSWFLMTVGGFFYSVDVMYIGVPMLVFSGLGAIISLVLLAMAYGAKFDSY
jgi:uncharacterized membrane protein